jgi:two-component system sensor histidine kinase UhpB
MQLTKLLLVIAALPIALVSGTSIYSTLQTNRIHSNETVRLAGETTVRATAAALELLAEQTSKPATSSQITRLLQLSPAIASITVSNSEGTVLASATSEKTAQSILPFQSDLVTSASAYPSGAQVRIFVDPDRITTSSADLLTSPLLLNSTATFAGVILALILAFRGWRIIERIATAIRSASSNNARDDLGETVISADASIYDAVVHLTNELKDHDRATHEELQKIKQETTANLSALQLREQGVRELFGRINNEVEKERRAIAVDIHDQFNASAISIRTASHQIIELCTNTELSNDSKPLIARYARQIATATEEIYARARDMVKNLRPELIEILGLEPSLKQLLRQNQESHPRVRYSLRSKASLPALSPEDALVIYRLVQEALNNISKHSGASLVEVVIDRSATDDATLIQVIDNGSGFTPDNQKVNTSLGLVGMRERAIGLGGSFEIRSARGEGTTVCLTLPDQRTPPDPGR